MTINWGILATGSIAHKFAEGLRVSKTGRLVATGSRTLEKAEGFAAEHGGRGYGSYQEVLADPEVQAVYIATPHHLHAENTIEAARAGKAILCEKPFTLNVFDAERAIAEVRAQNVFFMEAFMYRCSPQMRKVVELLKDGAIGTPRVANAEFSFAARPDWQNFRLDNSVGGGGLMDVGTYCVSFMRLVAGQEPEVIDYTSNLDRGFDAYGAGTLHFPSGLIGHFACGLQVAMRNDAIVYGDAGSLHIEDPWKSAPGLKMTLRRNGRDAEVFDLSCTNAELYAHEADAVAEFLERKECPFMSIEDTLGNMRTLDVLRESAGVVFA